MALDYASSVLKVKNLIAHDTVNDDVSAKISKILTEEIKLYIPNYQRELTWGKTQIETIIEDLSKTDKYLGSVSLGLKKNDDGKTIGLNILDGQQRLIFFYMISRVSFEINLFNDEKFKNKYQEYISKFKINSYYDLISTYHKSKEKFLGLLIECRKKNIFEKKYNFLVDLELDFQTENSNHFTENCPLLKWYESKNQNAENFLNLVTEIKNHKNEDKYKELYNHMTDLKQILTFLDKSNKLIEKQMNRLREININEFEDGYKILMKNGFLEKTQENVNYHLMDDNLDKLGQYNTYYENMDSIRKTLNNNQYYVDIIKNLNNSILSVIIDFVDDKEKQVLNSMNTFIDINDKGVSLNEEDIFKARLFQLAYGEAEYHSCVESWQNLKKSYMNLEAKHGINYSLLDALYHGFFILLADNNINLKYSYKFLITHNHENNDTKFKAHHDHLLTVLINGKYFTLKELISFFNLLADFTNLLISRNKDEYSQLFLLNGKTTHSSKLAQFILNQLIDDRNKVPKFLMLLYFYENIDDDNREKADIDDFLSIGIFSLCFDIFIDTKSNRELTPYIIDFYENKRKTKKNKVSKLVYDYCKTEIPNDENTRNNKIKNYAVKAFTDHKQKIKLISFYYEFISFNDEQQIVISKPGKGATYETAVSFTQKMSNLDSKQQNIEHFSINNSREFVKIGKTEPSTYNEETIGVDASLIRPNILANLIPLNQQLNSDMGNRCVFFKLLLLIEFTSFDDTFKTNVLKEIAVVDHDSFTSKFNSLSDSDKNNIALKLSEFAPKYAIDYLIHLYEKTNNLIHSENLNKDSAYKCYYNWFIGNNEYLGAKDIFVKQINELLQSTDILPTSSSN